MPVTTYKPSYVWTGSEVLSDISITVDDTTGKFLSVGNNGGDDEAGKVVHLPGKIMLPGFVNCHSHAFQRGLRGKGEEGGGNFWQWRESMYDLVTTMKDDEFKQHCALTFREMRASGCTSVGEFHYFHHGNNEARYKYDRMILEAAQEVGIR